MAKGNGKAPARGREIEVRPLTVKLTEPELLKRGDEMANCELEIEQFKVDRADVNDRIKVAVKRRAELAHVIEAGEEDREVKCEWVEDFQKNCFRLVRLDTSESVDTKPMQAADRIGHLFPEADAVATSAAVTPLPPPPRSPKERPTKPKAAKRAAMKRRGDDAPSPTAA